MNMDLSGAMNIMIKKSTDGIFLNWWTRIKKNVETVLCK